MIFERSREAHIKILSSKLFLTLRDYENEIFFKYGLSHIAKKDKNKEGPH